MQQQPLTEDVYTPQVAVQIGSLAVDASSVNLDRGMPDPLTGRGLRSASAVVRATAGDDVSVHVPTPWDPGAWPPAPETPARVSIDMGAGAVQSITGRVSQVAGDTSDRVVQVEVDDRYSTLDRPISWDELSAQMPDPVEGAPARYPALHTMSITDMILRECGWYATPPLLPACALSVPAQGTMWPEIGTLRDCEGWAPDGAPPSVYPQFYVQDWGLAANLVSASYTLAGGYTIKGRGRVELAAMSAAFTGRSAMSLEARTAAGGGVRLTWSGTTAYVWWADSTGWTSTGVSVPRVDGLLYARIEYVSDTSVQVTLSNAAGATDTATVTVPATVTTSPYTTALIEGDQLGAGFQIAFPGSASAGSLTGWVPSAQLHRWRGGTNTITVRPPVAGANCADLLDEQCEAEAATYWVDEQGVLQWWHLRELEAQASAATLTSDDHVSALAWTHDLASVKARVVVEWTELATQHSVWSRVTLWQAGDVTMDDGETIETFINVPDDEVWIQPDLAFTRIGDQAGPGGATAEDFNRGRRSWWGGVLENQEVWAYPENGYLTFGVERITGATFKGTLTRAGASTETRTPDATASSSVSRNKRSMALPILRGKMRYTLVKQTVTAGAGPDTAPDLVIDGGWWLQSAATAQRTADYYAARCTVPEPVLGDVVLVPVPGIQLGDVVTVVDDAVSRLTIVGVVTSDSRTVRTDSGPEHSISVRPLSVSRNGVTWEEWGAFMRAAQWQAWGAAHDDMSWKQWGTDPLDEKM